MVNMRIGTRGLMVLPRFPLTVLKLTLRWVSLPRPCTLLSALDRPRNILLDMVTLFHFLLSLVLLIDLSVDEMEKCTVSLFDAVVEYP